MMSSTYQPSLKLHLPAYPVFLFPSQPPVRYQPPTYHQPQPPPPAIIDDTLVSGSITVTLPRELVVQGVRVAWEVSYQIRENRGAPWGPVVRHVVAAIDAISGKVVDGSRQDAGITLPAGSNKYDFKIPVPADLPPSSQTPLSRLKHTVHASVIILSDSEFTAASGIAPADASRMAQSQEIEVHSMLPQRGAIQTLEWLHKEDFAGVGSVSIQAASGLANIGSALNFNMSLSNLLPSLTLYYLTVTLVQHHAANGEQAEEKATEYLLHKAGELHRDGRNGRPTRGGYLWRGAVGQALERAEAVPTPAMKFLRQGKTKTPPDRVSQPDPGPGSSITDSSLSISLPLRLPSTMLGAIPGTPMATVLPKGVERTMHKLKVEIFFTVMGQTITGQAFPASAGGETREGQLRKCVIQRGVELGPCSATPCNLFLPTYESQPAPSIPEAPPSSCPNAAAWGPLLNAREIQLVPGTAEPKVYPDHHLVTKQAQPGQSVHQRSCLCYWDGQTLEKYVGVCYTAPGRWGTVEPQHKP